MDIDKQVAREKEALEGGIRRYRRDVAADEVSTLGGRRIIAEAMDPASKAIDNWLNEALAPGAPAKGRSAAKLASTFKPDMLAYVTLKVVLESVRKAGADDCKVTHVATRIGNLLMAQARVDDIKAEHPGLYRRIQAKLASSPQHYCIRTAGRAHAWAKLPIIKWTRDESYKLGRTLMDIVGTTTGFFVIERWITRSKRQVWRVRLSDACHEALLDAHSRAEVLHPVEGPMVCPPRPWVGLMRGDGGFLSPALARKGMDHGSRKILKEVNAVVSQNVLDALNAVQNTRWRINRDVLDVASVLWEKGGGGGILPQNEKEPLPPMPAGLPKDSQEYADARRARREVHERNAAMIARSVNTTMALAVAREVADEPAIWYVHTMDFRGRMYPRSSYLSPQGDDLARGILTFADGKPLGERGAYWLAVHGANSYGEDKLPFDERVTWVQNNEPAILECAADPIGTTWWREADSPWQFLAFCFEWKRLAEWDQYHNDVTTFESSLPVGFDGSCNGLQHFAAMTRDLEGGKLVNLCPSDRPSDVYRAVADKCVELSSEHKASPERDLGLTMWESKLGRHVVKRNTMTQPYSVTAYGMREQILTDLPSIVEGLVQLPDPRAQRQEYTQLCRYMAGVHADAIGTVVSSAYAVQRFVKECAAKLAEHNLPMRWMTPIGLPLVMSYQSTTDMKRRGITVLGKKVSPTFTVHTDELSSTKQVLGAAPNFVHSMDATHMMATIEALVKEGVDAFGMVHDSYSCRAGEAEKLRWAIKESFIWLYRHDVLADLAREVSLKVDEVPELPTYGQLDIEDVRNADYFFA